ncbi:MAG: hypothetical protein WBO04_03315 [Steroidobacteraceae bacterium]
MKAETVTPVIAMPYRSHEDVTIESFARDPVYAAEYLKAELEDGDSAELQVALQTIARAIAREPPTTGAAE